MFLPPPVVERAGRGEKLRGRGYAPRPTASWSASHNALVGRPAGEVQFHLSGAYDKLSLAAAFHNGAQEWGQVSAKFDGDCANEWQDDSVNPHGSSLLFVSATTYVDDCNIHLVACSGR